MLGGSLFAVQVLSHDNARQLHAGWEAISPHFDPRVPKFLVEGHCIQRRVQPKARYAASSRRAFQRLDQVTANSAPCRLGTDVGCVDQRFSRVEHTEAKDAASFLRDLCTHKELTDLTGRWAIVRHLEAGLAYREIAERCHTSTATVTRVNQWLQHGTGGYRTVLSRLEAST